MNTKKLVTALFLGVLVVSTLTFFGSCDRGAEGEAQEKSAEPVELVLADASWDSIMVHNRIVKIILEEGYGNYTVDMVPGDTIPTFRGVVSGDIDVFMESWHENYLEAYNEAIEDGTVVNLGDNMPEAPQGWYIPRYMVEGDEERGIEAMAPELKTIEDLPKYWELVKDDENPDKGRIYVGPPGWAATERSQSMMEEFGLTDTYVGFLPGSGTALAASMVSAFESGEAWVGYYWEPTAVIGRLDMMMLKGSEFPPTSVDILMNAERAKELPELVDFFEKYGTSLQQNNKLLALMEDQGLDHTGAAEWFLKNSEDTWTKWVDEEIAERVRAAVK